MDVYEKEFGDLLYVRSRPTVYDQFYNANIKKMVTKYKFLPQELIECRMQSIWKNLLARNPNLRSRHESDVRAAQLLCAKRKQPVKMRKRKPKKNARPSYKPLRRRSQESGCVTESDANEDGQRDLFRTPLPGLRSKRNNRRAVEDRYMPLDIQVTRHAQALPEESKRPMPSECNDNEEEEEETDEEASSSTGHRTHDGTGYSEEVGNHDVVFTSKHIDTPCEASFHTVKEKQNSLISKKAIDTTAATKCNESDVAGTVIAVHSGHAATRNVTTDAMTKVSGLEHSQRKLGGTEQLDTVTKKKKYDADFMAHADKEAAQPHFPSHEEAGDSSDVTEHFATQTTVTISRSESDCDEWASAVHEDSESSKDGTPKPPNQLRRSEDTTLPDNLQDKPICGHSEESCSNLMSCINDEATTKQLKLQECDKSEVKLLCDVKRKQKDDMVTQIKESNTPGKVTPNQLRRLEDMALPDNLQDKPITGHSEESCSNLTSCINEEATTKHLKLQECDKSEVKLLCDVKRKQKDDMVTQLKESNTPATVTDNAATREKPVRTTPENDNYEGTGFRKSQKTTKSPVEPSVRKLQSECAKMSKDMFKVNLKLGLLKATENIQHKNSDHRDAKNRKQEPESTSHDAFIGHGQGRCARGRHVKTKLSLSYLTRNMAKNAKKHVAGISNKGEKLESRQKPVSVVKYTTIPTADKSDKESENDIQKNITMASCADKGYKTHNRPLIDKFPPGAGDKSDKSGNRQRPALTSQCTVSSNISDDDVSVVSKLHEGHKTSKKLLTDKPSLDSGNKSDVQQHDSQRPACERSQSYEYYAEKNVTVTSNDHGGCKIITDKHPADISNSYKPENKQRPAAVSKSADISGNNIQKSAAVATGPRERHEICEIPFTSKCPTNVSNRTVKNGQATLVLQHKTSTSKTSRGNNQENAVTDPEVHKGCNITTKSLQQPMDTEKKDSNVTEVVSENVIQTDDAQNEAAKHRMQNEQKKIHEKPWMRQSDSKKEPGLALAREKCMENTANITIDTVPNYIGYERQQKNSKAAAKQTGKDILLGPMFDSFHIQKMDVKDNETPDQVSTAYPKQHIRKDVVTDLSVLEKLKTADKEVQKDKTSSDSNSKLVASEILAEGSNRATNYATATPSERQWQSKLRGRTVITCQTPKVKASSAKATEEAAPMKCYDNDEAISNKESNQHPCSPPREAATLTKPRDHVLAQENFKTPTSVKSAELICPPTPLKRRSLRQNNMGSPVRINEEAFVDEQHSDPETPLGFRTKFTKQAKKAGGKEKQPQSQERSMYNEHNQQVQKREEQMDIETENEGQQSDPRSVKQQELARSSKPCSDHPSAKQPTISTCTHNGYALRKCQRLVPDTFSKDKDSSVSIAQPSQSMKEDAINDKHQQSSTNMDVEMSQTRSSDDLFGLTQYSTQHLETQKAVQDLSPMRDMQEDSVNEMEVDDDDDACYLTQTLNRMKACSLYSQNEERPLVTATNATGGALRREPNAESSPSEKQVAKRSHQEISENGEQIKKLRMPKEANDPRNTADNLHIKTDLEAGNDEDGSSILFSLDDDDEAAAHDGSHSFFQMKLTPTPLNFLKSPVDRNDSGSEDELFPWLADNPEPETNKRKCKPSTQNNPRESGMNRPDFKRVRFQEEGSGSQFSSERHSKPAKRVTIVDTAAQRMTKMYGKQERTFPIRSYTREHDDSDNSSMYGKSSSLLSRQEAEFLASDSEDDLGLVADNDYEV